MHTPLISLGFALILLIAQSDTEIKPAQIFHGGWIEIGGKYAIGIEVNGDVLWADHEGIETGKVVACSDPADDICFTWSDRTHANQCRYLVTSSNTSAFFIPLYGSNVRCPAGIFERTQISPVRTNKSIPNRTVKRVALSTAVPTVT